MKEIALSILIFSSSSIAYAASGHSDHAVSVSAQDKLQISMSQKDKSPISKTLTVSNCWIRSLPQPTPSAGYFVIKNTGKNDEKLTNLSISEFDQVSLHQTTNEDGKSRMSMAHDVIIPAGGELKFRPGGFHGMLEKPNQTLEIGTRVDAEFFFESDEKAVTTCEVKPPNTVAE